MSIKIEQDKYIFIYARTSFPKWIFLAPLLAFVPFFFFDLQTALNLSVALFFISFFSCIFAGILGLFVWAATPSHTLTIDRQNKAVEFDLAGKKTISQFMTFQEILIQSIRYQHDRIYTGYLVGEGHDPVQLVPSAGSERDQIKNMEPLAKFLSIPVRDEAYSREWFAKHDS